MGSEPRAVGGDFVAEVESGDQRRALEAMRGKLAEAMTEAGPNVLPQIAGRLQAVLSALAGLPQPEAKSKVDELAARRKARIAAAQARAAAQGDG